MNFLEQLAAEWYRYQGYLVNTNVKFGKLPKGGYVGEMDVVAFDPQSRQLVHVETSSDAGSWEVRRRRFAKKFGDAVKHYDELFSYRDGEVKRIAFLSFGQREKKGAFGPGIEVKSIPEFISEVVEGLRQRHPNPMKEVVPETFPILRGIQFAVHWGSLKRGVGRVGRRRD